MQYVWNKPLDNLPEEMTAIWSCVNPECNGWIRDSFSFNEAPVCLQCQSPMVGSVKKLPILISSDQQIKIHRRNMMRKNK